LERQHTAAAAVAADTESLQKSLSLGGDEDADGGDSSDGEYDMVSKNVSQAFFFFFFSSYVQNFLL